ncbi:MAG: phage holin family protein [Planctomycetaceae bacterium]
MRPQTPLEQPTNRKPQSLTGGVRDFVSDLISLLELQWQLLQVDLREGKSRLIRAAILLGISPVVALATLPVLFLGAAEAVSTAYGWSLAYTHLGLAGGVILTASLIGWIGLRVLTTSMATLTRSRNEFSENLAWLKSMLTSEERSDAAGQHSGDFDHRRN